MTDIHSERSSERPTVKNATEARQGVTGHNVRYVLFWGTGLVIVGLAVVWAFFF